MLRIFLLFFSIVSSIISMNVNADSTFEQPAINNDKYKIEVIFFEHTESDRFKHEHWPQFVGELNLNKVINWESLKTENGLTLNSEARIIKSSKTERFIKHLAWVQEIANNTKSEPIYITIGAEPEIQSLISIKPSKNMFNIKLDLIYNLQDKDKNLLSDVNAIRITREFKTKKKEIYYLDHPIIGIFIQIMPLDNKGK